MEEGRGGRVFLVGPSSERCDHSLVGGKAKNLWLLGRQVECQVPAWFCITTEAFSFFVQVRSKVSLKRFLPILCKERLSLATYKPAQ